MERNDKKKKEKKKAREKKGLNSRVQK